MPLLLLLPCRSADLNKAPQGPQILHKASTSSRKRKRGQEEQEAGHLSSRIREQPPSKRAQISPPSCTAEVGLKRKKERASDIDKKKADPLEYWTLTKRWPKEYFEQHSQIKEDLEQDSWLEEQIENPIPDIKYVEVNGFRLPCPIRKTPTSVRRKQSDSSLDSSCDQTNREKKSAPYRTPRYTTLLEGKGSYMREFDDDNTPKDMEDLCQRLLKKEQIVPQDSLYFAMIYSRRLVGR